MKTSELAKRSSMNIQTLRYYERRGLLRDPRPQGVGYRDYSAADLRRLLFIRRAKSLGFSLKEIEELLRLSQSEATSCADMESKARAKIRDIEQRIATLSAFKAALHELIEPCAGYPGSLANCPAWNTLEAETYSEDAHEFWSELVGAHEDFRETP